jgi:hypothetical protein
MKRIPFILCLVLLVPLVVVASCAATAIPTSSPTRAPTATPTWTSTPVSAVDFAPFQKLARSGGCNDKRNRLFLIDDQLVFWDEEGNCSDAAYSQTLYGSTPDQVLCVFHDSIAGPVRKCQDQRYQGMFNTMTDNLSKPDLGLGPGHTVQPVPF